MNWLAHLYLSEPDPAFQVGNLLPDLVSASSLADLPEEYQRGIRRLRRIDAFTDTHPLVKNCVRRFPPPFRRFGGVLTDVYFDHFLARDWESYSSRPLAEFITDFYRDINVCAPAIPAEALNTLEAMRAENWLGSYANLPGITNILSRISHRLRRPFDLTASLPIFQAQEAEFLADFRIFFPELAAIL